MTLAKLLATQGVTRALVVDDACDPVPRASDLAGLAGEWATFGADLSPDQRELVDGRYNRDAANDFDAKIADDAYVAAVWALRGELGEVAEPLFQAYMATQESDLRYVELVHSRLVELEVECRTIGRQFEQEAQDVDLVVIDLYFGGAQNEAAFEESKMRLRDAVGKRAANPPLVLLMSRSPRLADRRDEFRDHVGLVDSGFRILLKKELDIAGRLDRQIERLAENKPDTLRLAAFFDALERGVGTAADRSLKVMRRLKLSDIAQVQQLLLEFEGEPAGSYLVDVFDRVLQHEVEREKGIIDAAANLNGFTAERYPPPFVAGSPDLQLVVERMLTQNAERLSLPGSTDSQLSFGDVLRRRRPPTTRATPAAPDGTAATPVGAQAKDPADTPDEVLLVLTPACDLQRAAAPRVLLLVGELLAVDEAGWTYHGDARTPAIRIGDELRWIKWDLKHVDTLSWPEIRQGLDTSELSVVARLREAHALELQQRLLAGLGRVGLVASLPATFAVEVEAHVVDADGAPRHLEVPALLDGAVRWVGRDKDGKTVKRLVLTENGCDGLADALTQIDPDTIAQKAQAPLNHIRASGEMGRMLMQGLDITNVRSGAWTAVKATNPPHGVSHMALIAVDRIPPAPLDTNNLKKAGLLLIIRGGDNVPEIDATLELDIPEGEALLGVRKPGEPDG